MAISLNIPILWIEKWRSQELKGLIQSHTETAEGDLGLLIPRPLLFSTIITCTQSQPSPLSSTAGHRSTWSGLGRWEEVLSGSERKGRGWGQWVLIPATLSPRDPWPLDYTVDTLRGLRQHGPQHPGA